MAVSGSVFLHLGNCKNVVKSTGVASKLLIRITSCFNNVSLYSTASPAAAVNKDTATEKPGKKMSKAMMAYLERAKAYDTFIKQERQDYSIGKRHLANMMGEDPELFTDDDVNKAITYLFPSGLFDKAARPIMKPPEQLFPPRKDAEFDETGRPYHSMFYTTSPNYYKTLYDAVEQMKIVNNYEDDRINKGIAPDPNIKLDLASSEWITHKQLEKVLLESIGDKDYEYFMATMQRLADHPYAYKANELLMKFRKPRESLTESFTVPELEYDSDSRPFITVSDCMRKSARGSVTVRGKGSGKITVNGVPMINHFKRHQDYEQV